MKTAGLPTMYYAWALLVSSHRTETAAHFLDQVEAVDTATAGRLNGVRAIQAAFQHQIPEAMRLARKALQQLPADEYFFRQITGWNLSAAMFLAGEAESAVDVLEDVARVSLARDNYMTAIVTLCRLGSIQMQQGRLDRAEQYYQQALDIAFENRLQPMPAAREALIGLGKVRWEKFGFDEASHLLADGIALSKQWREVTAVEGLIVLTHLLQSRGDTDGARHTLFRAKEITAKNHVREPRNQYVALQEAFLYVRQGDLSFAHSWANAHDLAKYLLIDRLETSENTSKAVLRNFALIIFARRSPGKNMMPH